MTLRSRRQRRVDGMAALHADRGRRRAGTPSAPPTWPRHMRLLVGEIMVDRGRARGGQRVLEDGSSKKKALCGVSEAISSRVLGDLLCKYVCVPVKTRFFSPVLGKKRLRQRDTQTSRKIDLTYFGRPPLYIFYGCKYIMGIECWLAALQ